MSSSTNSFSGINSESDGLINDLSKTISLKESEDFLKAYPFTKSETKTKRKNGTFPKFDIIKKKRKDKEDNIRKKIKANFHKAIRKIINRKLKENGSKYLLDSFPSSFICDISKKTNFEVMELTYEQLFDYAYNKYKNIDGKDYIIKRKEVAEKKYQKNIEILKYLEENRKISDESGWEIIKNMKYKNLLKAYFNSNEFEQAIEDLSKKETANYTNAYIHFASTYVDYFLNYEPVQSNNSIIKNDINDTKCHSFNTIDLVSIFPSIFENEENDLSESLFFAEKDDYELSKNNCLFYDEAFLFNENPFN